MAKLRIAQQGWHYDRPAVTADDATVGVRLPWIEIDGHRIADGLRSVEFRAGPSAAGVTEVVITLFDPVEVVYVGADGEELTSEKMSLGALAGRFYNHLAAFVRSASHGVEEDQ